MKKIVNLEHLYVLSRWCYGIGEEIITDSEYGNIHRYMLATGQCKEYTDRSWSSDPAPIELLKEYEMEDKLVEILLSDKTSSIDSFTSESEVEDFYKYMDTLHWMSFKHDGFNLQITYYNGTYMFANTRGRSSDAIKLDHLYKIAPKEIPLNDGQTVIVFEATLSDEAFDALKKMFPKKNLVSQRSAVRTALSHADAVHLITLTAHDIKDVDNMGTVIHRLEKCGFKTPKFRPVNSYAELLEQLEIMEEEKKTYTEPTDGIVVRSNDGRVFRAIRVGSWEEKIHKSYVMGYEELHQAHSIPVKILIKPIKLKWSTQKRVTITNPNRILENNLQVGYPIAFKIKSDSTADIDEVTTRMLQEQYKNQYNYYRQTVDRTETLKSQK